MRIISLRKLLLVILSVLSLLGIFVLFKMHPGQMTPEKKFSQNYSSYTSDAVTDYEMKQKPSQNQASRPIAFEKSDVPTEFTQHAQEEKFVLILIMSAPYNVVPRSAIRQTWLSVLANQSVERDRPNIRVMKDPTNSSNNLLIQYFFVCGHYYDTEQKVESEVENEIRVYGDILRLNFTESYSLLVQKTLTSLRFASTVNVKFVVKIDDDMYLDVSRMVWRLKTSSLPEKLYGGSLLYRSLPIRRVRHKYFVSYQDFNDTVYPVYCNGPFYVMSKNVVLEFLNASRYTPSFRMEDAYMGVLAKKLGIVPTQLQGKGVHIKLRLLKVEWIWSDNIINEQFAIGDSLSPERLYNFHTRYRKLGSTYR